MVDHYEKPRNVGSFDKNDPNVGTGLVGAPACGDVMKLQIKVGLAPALPSPHIINQLTGILGREAAGLRGQHPQFDTS